MSRTPAIHNITLRSVPDRFAPPEKVLNLAIVEDIAFLSFRKFSETHDTETTTEEYHFEVDVDALFYGLSLLVHDHNTSLKKEPM